jgi:hypothetical protein
MRLVLALAAVALAAVHALDDAVKGVVGADPARAALVAEFDRCARPALRLAMALKTAGITPAAVDAHGQRMAVTYVPVPIGAPSAFAPDPTWVAALAALREDADALFPGLPPDEDPDAGDGTAAPAAA